MCIRDSNKPIILVTSFCAMVLLAWITSPSAYDNEISSELAEIQNFNISRVQTIIKQRCASCHSRAPTDEVFIASPGGVMLETLHDMQRWATRIKERSVDTHNMPFLNKTGMTKEERKIVGLWIDAGAPGE